MTVTDTPTPGTVLFALSAPNLSDNENVVQFNFNIDPSLSDDLGELMFTDPVQNGSFDLPTISQQEDHFKADGDGKYDIRFVFTSGGNTDDTFSSGDSLQYTISGDGITAESFDALSADAGGHGPFVIAAHVQNTMGAGSGGSGWITDSNGATVVPVPEPSGIVLAALGLLEVWAIRRRRHAHRPTWFLLAHAEVPSSAP